MPDNLNELSDDVLVAYADNEHSEDEMNRLKPLIEADADAVRKVEAFRRSGEQLRDFFSVDVPTVTPPEIAEKIKRMASRPTTPNKIVSLASYRQRLSRNIRFLASGGGLQKIAASLVIGAFIGLGGGSLYDYETDDGTSPMTFRGITTSVDGVSGALLLKFEGQSYASGSTISKGKSYWIEIVPGTADKISLIYYEKNEPPVTLIDRKSPVTPEVLKSKIEINTDALFVTFETRLEKKGQTSRIFSVFGIKK